MKKAIVMGLLAVSAFAGINQGPWNSIPLLDSRANHNIFIDEDSTLWVWGSNNKGQLGLGDVNARTIPTKDTLSQKWIAATTTYNGTASIDKNGHLWTSGNLFHISNAASSNFRQKIDSTHHWVAVSGGNTHLLLIDSTGYLYSMGYNSNGQIGSNSAMGGAATVSSPLLIDSTHQWLQVATGSYHSAAIRDDSTLWLWGDDATGQMGNGNGGAYTVPTQLASIGGQSKFLWVSADDGQTFAKTANGKVYAWGHQSAYELGIGSQFTQTSPVFVDSTRNLIWINTGTDHSLGIGADSTLYAWGSNAYGQIGLANNSGADANRTTPTALVHGKGTAISAGAWTTFFRHKDGNWYAMGINGNSQLGTGLPVASFNQSKLVAFPNTPAYFPNGTHIINDTTLREDLDTLVFKVKDICKDSTKYDSGNLTATVIGGTSSNIVAQYNTGVDSVVKVWSGVNKNGSAKMYFTCKDKWNTGVNDTVNFTVTPVNDAPYWQIVGRPKVDSLNEDQWNTTSSWYGINAQRRAVDIEQNKITYRAKSLTHHLIVDSLLGNDGWTLSVRTIPNVNGADTVEFTATDSLGASIYDTLIIKIKPVEDLPTWVGGNNNNNNRNEDFADTLVWDLKSNWVDGDGEALTFNIANSNAIMPKLAHSLINDTLRIWSVPNIAGGWAVVVTAKDPSGDSAQMQFFVNIASINDSPVLLGKGDTLVYVADSNSSYNVVAQDVDHTVYPNYSGFKPAWMSTHLLVDTLQLYGTPSVSDVGSLNPMTILVADGAGAKDSAEIYIKVVPNGVVANLVTYDSKGIVHGLRFHQAQTGIIRIYNFKGELLFQESLVNATHYQWPQSLGVGRYFYKLNQKIHPFLIQE